MMKELHVIYKMSDYKTGDSFTISLRNREIIYSAGERVKVVDENNESGIFIVGETDSRDLTKFVKII